MFFGILDHEANSLRCASAGQYPYPVLIEGYEQRTLSSRSRPIGLFDDASYSTRELSLPERFALILVSDGVLELLPPDSGRTKLQTFLNRLPPEADLDALVKGFRLPEGELLPDDVTILVVTREAHRG
jgi:serine phosphatase RsbU (regulator of sigma subunit)